MISDFLLEIFFSLFQPRHRCGGARNSVNWNNFAHFWEEEKFISKI
jgi:hypothetical protein